MELETVLKTILLDVPVIECFIQFVITAIALKITKERLDDEVISTVTLNCVLFFIPILGHVLFVIFIIRFVHLLKYLYGKKNKVRTCGNCAYLSSRKKITLYRNKVYVCDNEKMSYISYYKPSSPTDCPYHKFKNNNYNE